MTHLRRFLLAATAVCALTYTTFAGEMNCPVTTPPTVTCQPPTTTSSTTNTTSSPTDGTDATSSVVFFDVLTTAVQSVGTLL